MKAGNKLSYGRFKLGNSKKETSELLSVKKFQQNTILLVCISMLKRLSSINYYTKYRLLIKQFILNFDVTQKFDNSALD